MPNFQLAAKSLCFTNGKTKYSDILPPDNERESLITTLLHANTSPNRATEEVTSGTNAVTLLMVVNGQLKGIVGPTISSAGTHGGTRIIGSMGDDMSEPHPVGFNLTLIETRIAALVKLNDARTIGLPISDTDPVTVEVDQNDDEPVVVGEEPNGYARIGWPNITEEGHAPVVALLPKLFVVPLGTTIPYECDLLTTTFTEENCPMFAMRVWLNAQQHLLQHNGGHSIASEGCTLFPDPESIDNSSFVDFTIDPIVDVQGELTMLTPVDPDFSRVKSVIKALDNRLFTEASQYIEGGNEDTNTNNTGTGNNLTDIANAFKQVFNTGTLHGNSSLSRTEKNDLKVSQDTIARYMIMGARLVQQADGTQTMEPGTIRSGFKEFLESPRNDATLRDLRDMLTLAKERAREANTALSAFVNFKPDSLVDTIFTRTVQNAHWTRANPTQEPGELRTSLNIWVFLPPATHTFEYKERVDSLAKLSSQIQVGEDPTRTARRTTELYLRGKQESHNDVCSAIANLYAFFSQVVFEDFDNSLMWNILRRFFEKIRSDSGITWCEVHKSQLEIFKNLLLDIHNIPSAFAKLASNQTLRGYVKDDQPIPTSYFSEVEANSLSALRNISSLFERCDPDRYRNYLAFMDIFSPSGSTSSSSSSTPTKRPANRNNNSSGGSPPKQQATGFNNKATTTSTGKSALVYDLRAANGKQLSYPRISILKNPGNPNDKSLTALCFAHTITGRTCKFGNKCNFLHINRADDILPTSARKEFCDWVSKTPHLRWSEGCGPSSATDGTN